MLQQI